MTGALSILFIVASQLPRTISFPIAGTQILAEGIARSYKITTKNLEI